VGEQGFKFQGMSADMLVKVNEFACNLRDGLLDLPMDDRSRALLKENKGLKARIEAMSAQLDEGAADRPRTTSPRDGSSSLDLDGVHTEVHRVLQENADMKAKMDLMLDDVTSLLRRQLGSAQGHSDSVSATMTVRHEPQ
jgi:cell division septum initiation protein DivIVA